MKKYHIIGRKYHMMEGKKYGYQIAEKSFPVTPERERSHRELQI